MANLSYSGSLEIDWTQSLGHRCMVTLAPWHEGLGGIAVDDDEQTDVTLREVGDWVFGLTDPAVLDVEGEAFQPRCCMPWRLCRVIKLSSRNTQLKVAT